MSEDLPSESLVGSRVGYWGLIDSPWRLTL